MLRKKLQTKFPVARIKKIMQVDEDVGKVAVATPVLICKKDYSLLNSIAKALELFMQSLLDSALTFVKEHDGKVITPAHLKRAIVSIDQFDFLKDAVKNVPDAIEAFPTELPKRSRKKPAQEEEQKKRKEEEDEEDSEEQPVASRKKLAFDILKE